jgi:DNA-binding transcriptional MerR regulator
VDKAPDAFRTISEVADELDVPQHVLRFWETRFGQIRPMKRGGGRRYYRPDDVELLRGIRHLLYGEGYTIRGVQRILKEEGVKFVQGVWKQGAPQPDRPGDEDVAEGDADTAEAPLAPDDEADAQAAPSKGGRARDAAPASRTTLAVAAPSRATPQSVAARPASGTGESRLAEPRVQQSQSPSSAGLTAEELQGLRAALSELAECRRILDAVLKDAE